MDLQVKDKVALVAAATPDVGFTLARALTAEGARVVLTARAERGLHEAVEEIRGAGGRAFGMATDLNRLECLELLLDRMARVTGGPDILVLESAQVGVQNDSRADGHWGEGLTFPAAVRLVRAVLPEMQARGWGRMVHVTSVLDTLSVGQFAPTTAVHAEMTDFAALLAENLSPYDITLNTVALSFSPLDIPTTTGASEPSGTLEPAVPVEIGTALFLASQRAAGVTGQAFVVAPKQGHPARARRS